MKLNRLGIAARRLTALLLCALFVVSGAFAVSAADTSVTFGRNDKFSFSPTTTDLFDNFKNVIPGDTLTQTITVSNESNRTVEIFLRADGVKEKYKAFLSYIEITVEATRVWDILGVTSRELYKAPASEFGSGRATLRDRVSLGEFSRGAKVTLTVTADVSIEMGDDYQSAFGEIVWLFTAEDDETTDTTETTTAEETTMTEPETTRPYYPPYNPPTNPPDNPTVNPSQPDVPGIVEPEPAPTPEPEPEPAQPAPDELEDIEMGDVPLAPEQPDPNADADMDIDIPDINIPLGGLIPQTGDDWAVFITCAAAIAATIVIIILIVVRRRLDGDEKQKENDIKAK